MKDDMKHRGSHVRTFVGLALALLIGCAAGFIMRGLIPGKSSQGMTEIRQGGWKYINPLLECEQAMGEKEADELIPFRQSVINYATKDLKRTWGDDVSVYFRELNNGLHFEIGKDEHFYPASLLKVPMMISILKQAQANDRLLKTMVTYDDPKLQLSQNQDDPDKLILGRSYTVDDLLRRMIQYSDNVAYDLLLMKVADRVVYEQTHRDLGFPQPYHSGVRTDYVLSAEQYAACFRVLYNATYLRKTMSEKALAYLSTSDFKLGIVAGLPANIVVAHKFGFWAENGVRQLHDCGIVFYPKHPYILCVMTSGPDNGRYDPTIGELSRFIYQEINRQHGIL